MWVGDVATDVPAAATRKLLQSPPHLRRFSYAAHAEDTSGGSIGQQIRESLFGAGRRFDGAATSAVTGRKLNCIFSCNNEGNEGTILLLTEKCAAARAVGAGFRGLGSFLCWGFRAVVPLRIGAVLYS